jgi:hypothetical protein
MADWEYLSLAQARRPARRPADLPTRFRTTALAMPKLLVLFLSSRHDVAQLAHALVEGARTVRFAEVDLRHLADDEGAPRTDPGEASGTPGTRTLGRIAEIASYDGVVCVTSGDDAASIGARIGRLDESLVNKVGSVVTTATGRDRSAALCATLIPMGNRGMILVPAPFTDSGEPAADAARRLGKRVAEVIGWVTHARSHHHH